MRTFIKYGIAILLLGCGNRSVDQADLRYLNGYWEISQVELPDGSIRDFTVNPNVDFINLEGTEGFRTKMQPRFDGRYTTSMDTEQFTLTSGPEGFILHYENELSSWEEKLLALDSLSFSVVNGEGIIYTYSRFEPINIPQ